MSEHETPDGAGEDYGTGSRDVAEDFTPVDLTGAITAYLVRGETRDSIAAKLRISRLEVDARIADATGMSEAEALNEREWVVREKIRDITRQASAIELPSFETTRLALLLDLAKLELGLIGWARRRQGVI